MLTVMMGVLAFFVVITMTLSAEQGLEVQLPASPEEVPVSTAEAVPPLVVEMVADRQMLVNGELIAANQIQSLIQSYLQANPEGFVILKPDRQLPYSEVVQQLGIMRDIGGDRVSLTIDE
jgi:biopolymer transport protein ExbD